MIEVTGDGGDSIILRRLEFGLEKISSEHIKMVGLDGIIQRMDGGQRTPQHLRRSDNL